MDVEEIVSELYGLPPSRFIEERDRRSGEARAAGNRELATALRQLRKPTAGAWLANQLIRLKPQQVSELLEIGVALREAQDALAGEDLAKLSRQRQQLVNALSRDVRRRVAEAGHTVTSAAVIELEDTVRAALGDPEAAEALRAGRLTVALRPDPGGFGVASTAPAATPDRRPDRAAAQAALRHVQQAAEHAEHAEAAASQAVQRQQEAAAALRRRRADLQAELDRVRAEESLAARELQRLASALEEAQRRVAEAARELREAQADC